MNNSISNAKLNEFGIAREYLLGVVDYIVRIDYNAVINSVTAPIGYNMINALYLSHP